MGFPTVFQVAFSAIKGITTEVATAILDAVGSEERFFRMQESELSAFAGVNSKFFSESYRSGLLEWAERELAYVAERNIGTYYFTDADYPARFHSAQDAPLLLFAKGGCNLNAKRMVSIVGTRHATSYGIGLCRELVAGLKDIAGEDVVIVSGLAYGIDVAAHSAALSAGLPTVAVMAHGLDMIYPSQHRPVAVDIVNGGGAVVTEYGSGTRIHRSNFLARNRIIAGLSDCTVVIESAAKGGALVTANIAQGYGREVAAFPGRAGDEYSEGCNALIRKNVAALVCSAEDVADMLQWKRTRKPVETELFVELTAEEQSVADCLRGRDAVHLNELSVLTKMAIHKLLSILFDMEMKGVVCVLPGNRYRL